MSFSKRFSKPRFLCLQMLKVVGDHIVSLVSNSGVEVKLSQLSQLYRREFGYQLRPDTYGHNSINALISKHCFWCFDTVQVALLAISVQVPWTA